MRAAVMSNRCLSGVVVALTVLVPGTTAWAQVEVEPDQRYLLLATERTSTMQEELEEAAALGFRIVTGSPTSGNEMAILLERMATPPDTYQYRLLATTRTSTMQEELSEAAAEGFRLLPTTLISKSRRFGGDEIIVMLERSPTESDQGFEYRLIATNFTGTMQTEITQALDAGFTISGLVSRGEHMVIMERQVP